MLARELEELSSTSIRRCTQTSICIFNDFKKNNQPHKQNRTPIYDSTTKKKNYKANDVFVYSKIIKQMMCLCIVKLQASLKTPESHLYLLKDSIFI